MPFLRPGTATFLTEDTEGATVVVESARARRALPATTIMIVYLENLIIDIKRRYELVVNEAKTTKNESPWTMVDRVLRIGALSASLLTCIELVVLIGARVTHYPDAHDISKLKVRDPSEFHQNPANQKVR
jgi:hypothetical protein